MSEKSLLERLAEYERDGFDEEEVQRIAKAAKEFLGAIENTQRELEERLEALASMMDDPVVAQRVQEIAEWIDEHWPSLEGDDE